MLDGVLLELVGTESAERWRELPAVLKRATEQAESERQQQLEEIAAKLKADQEREKAAAKAEQERERAAAKAEAEAAKAAEAAAKAVARERAKQEAEQKKAAHARSKAEKDAEAKAAAEAREQAREQAKLHKEAEKQALKEAAAEDARDRRVAAERAKTDAKRAKVEAAERARRQLEAEKESNAAASTAPPTHHTSASNIAQQRLERAQSRLSIGGASSNVAFLGGGTRRKSNDVAAMDVVSEAAEGSGALKKISMFMSGGGSAVSRSLAPVTNDSRSDPSDVHAAPAVAPELIDRRRATEASRWIGAWQSGGGTRATEIASPADCIAPADDQCGEIVCVGDDGMSSTHAASVRSSVDGGVMRRMLGEHSDRICCICGGSGSSVDLIATGSRDKTIRLWNRSSGNCLRALTGCDEVILTLAMRGSVLMSGEGGRGLARSRLYDVGDVQDGESELSAPSTSGSAPTVFTEHGGPIFSVDVGEELALTGSDDQTARVWPLWGGRRSLGTLRHPAWVGSVSIAGVLAATGSADGRIRLWSLVSSSYPCVHTIQHGATVADTVNLLCVRLMFGGNVLLSGGPDGVLKIWAVTDAMQARASDNSLQSTCVASLQHGSSVRGIVPGSMSIATSGGAGRGRKNIVVWTASGSNW